MHCLLPGPLAYQFLSSQSILLRHFLQNLSKDCVMSGTVKRLWRQGMMALHSVREATQAAQKGSVLTGKIQGGNRVFLNGVSTVIDDYSHGRSVLTYLREGQLSALWRCADTWVANIQQARFIPAERTLWFRALFVVCKELCAAWVVSLTLSDEKIDR